MIPNTLTQVYILQLSLPLEAWIGDSANEKQSI